MSLHLLTSLYNIDVQEFIESLLLVICESKINKCKYHSSLTNYSSKHNLICRNKVRSTKLQTEMKMWFTLTSDKINNLEQEKSVHPKSKKWMQCTNIVLLWTKTRHDC